MTGEWCCSTDEIVREFKDRLDPKETIMTEMVTLKEICDELKLDPREDRECLRLAARDREKHTEISKHHQPRSPWQWEKGSAGEREARRLLAGQ